MDGPEVVRGVQLVDPEAISAPFDSVLYGNCASNVGGPYSGVVWTGRRVEGIQPVDDERLALRTLPTKVHRLRNLMGPTADETLLTRSDVYVICVARVVVDADRFKALAGTADLTPRLRRRPDSFRSDRCGARTVAQRAVRGLREREVPKDI